MGFKNNLTSNLTNKIGNSVFKIENVDGKGAMPTTIQELRERRERAEAIVKRKSLMSSTMSVVPIPGLDFGVDLKLMKDIIEDVNKIYGLDHKQVNSLGDDVKEKLCLQQQFKVVNLLVKNFKCIFKIVIRDVAKRTAAKQTKWFPVVGQAVSASISYYFMNKIGKDHIQKCENVIKNVM